MQEPDDFVARLLGAGYEAASSYPLVPHIKNRSEAQQQFVSAALRLDRPGLAAAYSRDIANFRRGLAYAQIAFYYAENGQRDKALAYVHLADAIADAEGLEQWRVAKILVAIARAHAELGDLEEAKRLLTPKVVAISGKSQVAAEVLRSMRGSFEEQFAVYDHQARTGEFENIKIAMVGFVNLYRDFHDETQKRDQAMAKLLETARILPPSFLGKAYLDLAGHSLDHGDTDQAKTLIGMARAFMAEFDPPAIASVPYEARLAGLMHRAGDQAGGQRLLDKAVKDFEAEIESIKSLDASGVQRSIAEAYVAMGDLASARLAYRRTLELGLVNPNLRPRVTDFTAACISMALNGLEPDAMLSDALRQAQAEITKP